MTRERAEIDVPRVSVLLLILLPTTVLVDRYEPKRSKHLTLRFLVLLCIVYSGTISPVLGGGVPEQDNRLVWDKPPYSPCQVLSGGFPGVAPSEIDRLI